MGALGSCVIQTQAKMLSSNNLVHNVCVELLIQNALVCKAHLACVVWGSGGMPPRKFLKIRCNEIES